MFVCTLFIALVVTTAPAAAESGTDCRMRGGLPPIPLLHKDQAQKKIHVLIELCLFPAIRGFSFILFQVGGDYLHISTLNSEMHSC